MIGTKIYRRGNVTEKRVNKRTADLTTDLVFEKTQLLTTKEELQKQFMIGSF